MTADLSRLSDGERRVLALLAAGHTAKSAAAATGLSVNAVNERLREARRKTGVGSSRELARLVGPQENRDEEIGVAPRRTPGDPHPAAAPHPPHGGRRRSIVMGFLLIGAIGAAIIVGVPQATPAEAAPDAVSDRLFGDAAYDPRAMRQRMLAEQRDVVWAEGGEARLLTLYGQVPGVRGLAVTCRATLCEVSGGLPADVATAGVNAAQAMPERMGASSGLTHRSFVVADERGAARFAAYWERQR